MTTRRAGAAVCEAEEPRLPPVLIDISVEDEAWLGILPDLFVPGTDPDETVAGQFLADAVARALMAGGATTPTPCGIAMLLADDARVAVLNGDFRGKPRPTNILSFPAGDGEERVPGEPLHLGDLALARETLFRESEEQGKSARDHVIHLIVHGVLHLLGHDHADDGSAREMEALERRILAEIGIPDPYGGGDV